MRERVPEAGPDKRCARVRLPLPADSSDGAWVALTFDDGPDPVGTPLVLDALRRAGATASFFVIGPAAAAHPDVVARTLAEGHRVELHCTRHLRHTALIRDGVARDVDAGLATLAALGVRPARWRPPWGVVAPFTGAIAAERGLTLTGWTADTRDWRGDRAEVMLAGVSAGIGPGRTVLMHDGLGPGARRRDIGETARLVGPLVELVRARGCRATACPPA